ncbi:MAG: NAD(P)/FAD-dependent oxidoreductase [Candidatus Lokiarchaeota archaeon]|nr:NAD(P)/FAD-dependent oxidoreductase [Candidatus Lokiarchaeota archaeon]
MAGAINFFDVLVIGAGPSGSIAAKNAADNGFSTCLIEKDKIGEKGRYKACGGGIPFEVLEEIQYPEEKVARFVESLEYHHVDGEYYSQKGKGATVWRSTFDKYLLDLAIMSGVVFREKEQLLNLQKLNGYYEIITNNSKFRAKYLIAADGITSTTLKLLKWPFFQSSDVWLTTTHEMKTSKKYIEETLETDKLHLFFGREITSAGYSWLFPKKDVVTLGWGNQINLMKNSRKEFRKISSFPLIEKILTNSSIETNKSHLIPMGVRPKIYEDNVFAVGDAGGFVDPINGMGIPYAIFSGQIAVEAIKIGKNKGEKERLGDIYENLLDRSFLNMLKQKRTLREKIYQSDANLKQYLSLLENNSSEEIILKKLF